MDPDPEAQKHMDLTDLDPDPQHCLDERQLEEIGIMFFKSLPVTLRVGSVVIRILDIDHHSMNADLRGLYR